MMLYEIAYIILLGWLSWEDIEHLQISVWGLVGIGILGLWEVWRSPNIEPWIQLMVGVAVWLGLNGIVHLLRCFTKRQPMGQGDIWLISLLTITLPWEYAPYFILGIGMVASIGGIMWKHWKNTEPFPMVPAIGIAFLMIRITAIALK